MTQPSSPDPREETAAMLAAAGIVVTDEGRARARAKLAEADARWTPERRARLRESWACQRGQREGRSGHPHRS